MQKPPPSKRPWEWKPLVRSRAIECFWFAAAATFSFVYVLALLVHGAGWLAAWGGTTVLVVGCLALGLWNRRKRRQESDHRLLP
jgi:Flp pilus assembly protein TadB